MASSLASRLALTLVLCTLRGASGAIDCAVYEDVAGAKLRHTASRTVPCDAKSQGDSCTYMLNLTRPDASLHTTDLAVDGCCVQDVSGQYFCSSQRSRDASPTALTIKKLLGISYQCQGGSVAVSKACDTSLGFQSLCQQGAGSPDDNCQVNFKALACRVPHVTNRRDSCSASTKVGRQPRSCTISRMKICRTTSSAPAFIQTLVPTAAVCPGFAWQEVLAKRPQVPWTTLWPQGSTCENTGTIS